jgi:hypothetical protein
MGRKLLNEDQIEEIDHYPEACGGCGHEFAGEEKVPCRRPEGRQVAELPPIAVVYSSIARTGCVVLSAARGPRLCCLSGSATRRFGPCLAAAVISMTARNHVSRRDMSELARELFGLGLSVGSIDAVCQRATGRLPSPTNS